MRPSLPFRAHSPRPKLCSQPVRPFSQPGFDIRENVALRMVCLIQLKGFGLNSLFHVRWDGCRRLIFQSLSAPVREYVVA